MGDIKDIVFIDTEVDSVLGKILDCGAISEDGMQLHTNNDNQFYESIEKYKYLCGHNIINHDLKYMRFQVRHNYEGIIDTLHLSPLLFPDEPCHALLKDDKLQVEELNNPLNDSKKCMELFYKELNAYNEWEEEFKQIIVRLLGSKTEFRGFFRFLNEKMEIMSHTELKNTERMIKEFFEGKICSNVNIANIMFNYPVELAYCLSLIRNYDHYFVIPRWVHIMKPKIETVMNLLRGKPCSEGCLYCNRKLDIKVGLKNYFGYEDFRLYEGEALQENAVRAAMNGKSLIAVFPTGGGKSLTFQLPALIQGSTMRALTVVISPLQSLMKDQVDNLEKRGIADAVTINGILSPIERAEAIERVESGRANILYISPEQLRSKTIERILLARNIARFVIDEAHCFSAWGQDFRVEYLYIGEFIRELQNKKGYCKIPVSCFTATAKQKVIMDIKDYFKKELNIEMELFATNASRKNLRYEVIHCDNDEEKYTRLRSLIDIKECPTIVYVSRTKKTLELAERLCKDGFTAKAYNGKMERNEKIINQEEFINDKVQIMVATSAFGMGVDKSNVKLVIHYDISDSLENYVQEAGRAGRDPSLQAECYILFSDNDLDKHFVLLNQTKLSISEIQQVWKAIKDLTKTNKIVRRSPLEIARQAGWDENVQDVETRVKTAILSLERAGYVKRGKNAPRIYATSICVKSVIEAREKIEKSNIFESDTEKENAVRIVSSLISKRNTVNSRDSEAESRVDYLADQLGIDRKDILKIITRLRQIGILKDENDLKAYINISDKTNKVKKNIKEYNTLELLLYKFATKSGDGNLNLDLKGINDYAQNNNVKYCSVNKLKSIIYYWLIKGYIEKNTNNVSGGYVFPEGTNYEKLEKKISKRHSVCEKITEYLYNKGTELRYAFKQEVLISFSEVELNKYLNENGLNVTLGEIEDALLYMAKTYTVKLEEGFLVIYASIEVERIHMDNRIKYKVDDYKQLSEYYKQKIQQIHIVGAFANMMVSDYNKALEFVNDYFQLDYKKFLNKYFKAEQLTQMERNITPEKYNNIFGDLSVKQLEIINDAKSQYIVCIAGPGSGKTRVLVHKLASLLLLEDVKHEELLMLTFSRAAANEFKQRLHALIGNAASYVEIKTFHSYSFDLVGKIGTINNSEHIVKQAVQMFRDNEIEQNKVVKSVLVIDEAQDMDEENYELVCELMKRNEEMRVIMVGDDDQNIYQFRGSDSKYLKMFQIEKNATCYEMTENYRSKKSIVNYANNMAQKITERLKSQDIIAVSDERGDVIANSYKSNNMEIPLVEDVIHNYKGGNIGILVEKNEEALQIYTLLHNKGYKPKLIQENDGFLVYDLIEIRYFIKQLNTLRDTNNPIISSENWNEAKNKYTEKYEGSETKKLILNMLKQFEIMSPVIYYSDFEQFLKESKLEDFYDTSEKQIFVSTIHKSKGKEFDEVYMMLKGSDLRDSQDARKVYVGITRAKSSLHIHYSKDILKYLDGEATAYLENASDYGECDRIMTQLSLKDVYLDSFENKSQQLINIKSGQNIEVKDNQLFIRVNDRELVNIPFSKNYKEKMMTYEKKGYKIINAKVRFMVAWLKKDTQKTFVIPLADIEYEKNK